MASAVISYEEIENFQLKDASPLKIKIKNFMPDVKDNEAKELLMQALDWHNEKFAGKEKKDFGMIGLYVFSIIILILRTFTAYSGSLIEPLVGLITLWFVKRWNKRRKLIALSLWMLAFLMAYISFVNNKFSNNSF